MRFVYKHFIENSGNIQSGNLLLSAMSAIVQVVLIGGTYLFGMTFDLLLIESIGKLKKSD